MEISFNSTNSRWTSIILKIKKERSEVKLGEPNFTWTEVKAN